MKYHLGHLISGHGSLVELILFLVIFIVIWNIENIAGVLFSYKKWRHAWINAPFAITNLPGQLLLGIAFAKTIEWTKLHHFGLLYEFHLKNPLLVFIIAFTLLDLGEYIYHVIMHKIKGLWMFHVVHHSDNIVDVSTTLREHPGENIIRLSFTLVWMFLTGAFFWILVLRQIIQSVTTLFAHMNYQLPEKVDTVIGILFITPNLHHVHHHYRQPYTDSNYGDVLSIWDRLFGTFKKSSAEPLVFGIDAYMEKKYTANFFSLVKLPFRKYRNGKTQGSEVKK